MTEPPPYGEAPSDPPAALLLLVGAFACGRVQAGSQDPRAGLQLHSFQSLMRNLATLARSRRR